MLESRRRYSCGVRELHTGDQRREGSAERQEDLRKVQGDSS